MLEKSELGTLKGWGSYTVRWMISSKPKRLPWPLFALGKLFQKLNCTTTRAAGVQRAEKERNSANCIYKENTLLSPAPFVANYCVSLPPPPLPHIPLLHCNAGGQLIFYYFILLSQLLASCVRVIALQLSLHGLCNIYADIRNIYYIAI